MLKILNESLPVSFGKKVFYDDQTKMPVMSKKESINDINKKAVDLLNVRLNESIETTINRCVEEYGLREPLNWALADIVKYLAVLIKKKRPSSRKIKVSATMAFSIGKIWKDSKHFQYVVNSSDVPSNMAELTIHMLGIMEKINTKKGRWTTANIEEYSYPCICSINKNTLFSFIEDEKKDLSLRVNDNNIIKETIMTILIIESLIINHVDAIEKYYINAAKNISKIYDDLKVYFRG